MSGPSPAVCRERGAAFASRFWVFWIRNTMRNVMIVVAVLMTSSHVSE